MGYEIVRAHSDAEAARTDEARMHARYKGDRFSVVYSVDDRPCPYLIVRHDLRESLKTKVLVSLAGGVVAIDKRILALDADRRVAI